MLSTPVVWILFPILAAGVTGVFYKRALLNLILTGVTAVVLALLAAFFPEDLTLSIGPLALSFSETLGILGRQIALPYEMLSFVAFMFGMTALWIFVSGVSRVPALFRTISLMVVALLIAALGVTPFLYAALLIQTAVLAMIPLLSPVQEKTRQGVLRYLSLQTLAMPFILLAGWLLSGVEVLPSESRLVTQTAFSLGLGFALWLAVFPFHSWVPMVSAQASPLVTGFLFFVLPTAVIIFGLNFIDQYALLRESAALYRLLRLMGTLMIVLSGAWTAFQTDLKRAFGFAALTETGFVVLSVGLLPQDGLEWLLLMVPLRGLGLWLWSYLLTLFSTRSDSLSITNLRGLFRMFPFLSAGLILAQLSLAGFPLLASFPVKINLLTAVFEMAPALAIWIFLGSLGLFVFTIRLLNVLVTPPKTLADLPWAITEHTFEIITILLAVLVLVAFGLFPNVFLPRLMGLTGAFTHLQ